VKASPILFKMTVKGGRVLDRIHNRHAIFSVEFSVTPRMPITSHEFRRKLLPTPAQYPRQ